MSESTVQHGFVPIEKTQRWGIPHDLKEGIAVNVAGFGPTIDDCPDDDDNPLRRIVERMLADYPMRHASTRDIMRLKKTAAARGYNRQLGDDPLDPAGKHIIVPKMFHYHVEGKRVPVHLRCNVWVKRLDMTQQEMEAIVDAADTDDEKPIGMQWADLDVVEVFSLPILVNAGDRSWYGAVDARWATDVRLSMSHTAEEPLDIHDYPGRKAFLEQQTVDVPVPRDRLDEVRRLLAPLESNEEFLRELDAKPSRKQWYEAFRSNDPRALEPFEERLGALTEDEWVGLRDELANAPLRDIANPLIDGLDRAAEAVGWDGWDTND